MQYLAILISLFIWVVGVHAEVNVSVDRNPINMGETFRLLFKSAGGLGTPDLSPLRQDFDILGQSSSSSTSLVNGKISSTEQLILELSPKRSGQLQIPALQFGSGQSMPSLIVVNPSTQATSGAFNDSLFLEVELSNETPYIQAQTIYTMRFYHAVSVDNGSLSEPSVSGGNIIVERFGDDRKYQTNRADGRNYIVIERKYLIYPQKTGTLKIDPIVFNGEVGGQVGLGGVFNTRGRKTILHSEAKQLEVRPIPASFPSGEYWLPLENLVIEEQWAPSPPQFKQGEPMTRFLKLQATGMPASQLPDIKMDLKLSAKTYPDQPVLNQIVNVNGLIAERTQKVAIIPTTTGEINFPAIQIPWWDTQVEQLRYAKLPAHAYPVSAGSFQSVTSPPTVATPLQNNAEARQPVAVDVFWRTAFFLSILLWLALVCVYLVRRHGVNQGKPSKEATESERRTYRRVIQVCANNDLHQIVPALLSWARAVWRDNPPLTLAALQERCPELSPSLAGINQCLYGQQKKTWDGDTLALVFKHLTLDKEFAKPQNTPPVLEPLNRL